jgi:hypothetical protein
MKFENMGESKFSISTPPLNCATEKKTEVLTGMEDSRYHSTPHAHFDAMT